MFIFVFVLCLVCLMLPVSRLSILCCVVFISAFVLCIVCLMLPVSRYSILCVVLCQLLLVFFFFWSLHGLSITADDYTFGVLDIFLRNKYCIPHTWLYLWFCSLLIYVILVHTIILFCTPSVRLLFAGTWVKSRDLGVDRVSNLIICLFLFCFYCLSSSCVLCA